MTLFILDQIAGGDPVFPGTVGMHLIEISNMDTGYGETPDGTGLIQVTYARTQSGIPPQRLDELVNTDFPVPASGPDILIAGVDHDFSVTLGDGVTMGPISMFSGTALLPGTGSNPTTTILVIYDTSQCNGQGYWVVDGSGNPTSFRGSVLLYHELSHAHDFALGNTTSEPEAHADENDMRAQVGDTLRHPTERTGACGTGPGGGPGPGPTCCMVASVATGSAYSDQVGVLRRLRDGLLRTTDMGYDFFERLHYEYYAFSPQVCTAMARDREVHDFVRRLVVEPLIAVLDTACLRFFEDPDCETLGRAFDERTRTLAASGLAETELAQLRHFIDHLAPSPDLETPEPLHALLGLVGEKLAPDGVARWALLDSVAVGLDALEAQRAGEDYAEVGRRLSEGFDAWLIRLPLTEIWDGMSEAHARRELRALERHALRRPDVRRAVYARLAQRGSEPLRRALVPEAPAARAAS